MVILMLSPTVAVVTNIEAVTLVGIGSDDQARLPVVHQQVPFWRCGAVSRRSCCAVINAGCEAADHHLVWRQADVSIADINTDHLCSSFTVRFDGGSRQQIKLNVPGIHNVLNATAAFAAARDTDIAPAVIAAALESFQGVDRRFQVKSHDGITIIDDYAHHPTEIRATLA